MRRRWLTRRTLVLAGLAGALLGLLSATRTWVTVQPEAGALLREPIEVSGADAATSVTALAIVVLAASLAVTIAGRVARYVVAALLVLAGSGMIAAAVSVIGDPARAAAGSVGEAAGTVAVEAEYMTSAWPAVAIAAGALVALVGLGLALLREQLTADRKYAADSADAAGTETQERPEAAGARAGHVDEIDGWDRLTRGEDPTG